MCASLFVELLTSSVRRPDGIIQKSQERKQPLWQFGVFCVQSLELRFPKLNMLPWMVCRINLLDAWKRPGSEQDNTTVQRILYAFFHQLARPRPPFCIDLHLECMNAIQLRRLPVKVATCYKSRPAFSKKNISPWFQGYSSCQVSSFDEADCPRQDATATRKGT